jgi:PAS domain S-box-containing protein
MVDGPPRSEPPDSTRLQQAVQASGEIIFMTDREGVFTFVNAQFERLYGHTAADVVGRLTPRILKGGAVSPERYAAFWERLSRGETIEHEFLNRTKDGTLLRVQAVVSPIRDDRQAIVGFLAVQRDVTEHRKVEQDLRRSQAHLQLISDNVLDLVSQIRSDGTFKYLSPSYQTVLGYAPGQLLGTPAFSLVHPEDVERVQAVFLDGMALGTAGRAEFRYRHADGRYLWVDVVGKVIVDATGSPAGAVLSGRDITERKRSEQALLEHARRLTIAVEGAEMSVFTQDRDLRFTWMHNPQLLASAEQAIGHTDAELLPPELAGEITRVKRRALESGRRERDEISVKAEGERRVFEILVEPHRAADGTIDGITGALLNITKRRELEEQLRQSQKLEAVGSLASGIAHDFNNLLTVVQGYAELAASELDPGSPIRQDLLEIQTAAASAESLTRQLLIFSRKSVVHPVSVDLNDVVERLERILRRVVGENIDLRVKLAHNLGFVKADAGQLEQVVMNLVVNARDAMPSGGSLTIETAHAEIGDWFARTHGVSSGGAFSRISVIDTGAGMTDDVRAQIFVPFFTTKGPEKGTGLGLATVHGIVQQAGGFIVVESEPGRGSTFAIHLPRVSGPTVADAAERSTTIPSGGETILFVEDNDSIRALGARILIRCGYTVISARHAAEALALAATQGQIDLLVTDLVMPGLNGRVLAEQLRQSHGALKVLIASGYTTDSVALRDIQTSGMEFLKKPYTSEGLARAVRATLDRS